MSTPADRLKAKFDKAEATILANLGADTYRVVRMVKTRDPGGGEIEVETYPETDRCLLQRGNTRGSVSLMGAVILSTADYLALLPSTSIVKASDELEVNGDHYNIIAIKPRPNVGVGMIVELERQG